MIDIQQITEIIDRHEIPSEIHSSDLRDLVDQYPYFQVGIFAYLKMLYTKDTYENFMGELRRLSIFLNDRRALFYFIFEEEYKVFFRKTGKLEIKEDRTNILLNAFFDSRNDLEMDTQLEYSLINSSLATNDYFLYVENVEHKDVEQPLAEIPVAPLKCQNIIDTFIEKSEKEGGLKFNIDKNAINEPIAESARKNEEVDDMADDRFFTETLAKIYIKQKKYEKAYKIIKHLSLNYPKKNIYFADQLSFLEKLIINSKYKK